MIDNLTTSHRASPTQTFVYDSLKRLTSTTNPESGTVSYQHDNNSTTGMGYGTADGIRKKFTGYERDAETGLDYAQAPYFSFAQGRFTSPDPLLASAKSTDPQTWNRYSYVSNNPLVYIDPSGLSAQPGGRNISNWNGAMATAEATDGISPWPDTPEYASQQQSSAASIHELGHTGQVGVGDTQGTGDATPVNFQLIVRLLEQSSERRNESGIFGSYLFVTVTWESSTGKLDDLGEFRFREKLEYPDVDTNNGSYTAPEPFNFSNRNPYYSSVIRMSEGGAVDRHAGYSVLPPYKPATATVRQTYQYSRDGRTWIDVGSTTITRTVGQLGGSWRQTITIGSSRISAQITLPARGFYQLN